MSERPPFRYLYLHGFASRASSRKGVFLRDALRPAGIDLELLDINVPSFERQTYTDILAFLDRVDATTPPGRRLRVAGSSMGGYLAARWAELRPERVDRLFLLCPGFDLANRWPLLLGEEQMRRWRTEGQIEIEDTAGVARRLHWAFVDDAHTHPAWPEVPCRTRIVHGARDEVVPVDFSRSYAAARPHVELIELDDEHTLMESLDTLVDAARSFLGGV